MTDCNLWSTVDNKGGTVVVQFIAIEETRLKGKTFKVVECEDLVSC